MAFGGRARKRAAPVRIEAIAVVTERAVACNYAAASLKAAETHRRTWLEFRNAVGSKALSPPLSTSVFLHYATWLHRVDGRLQSIGAVRHYVAAAIDCAVDANMVAVEFDRSAVKLFISKGLPRYFQSGANDRKTRERVSDDDLRALAAARRAGNEDDAAAFAIVLILYWGVLRVGSVLRTQIHADRLLRFTDIEVLASGAALVVHAHSSKTNHTGAPETRWLEARNDELCPVKAWRNFISQRSDELAAQPRGVRLQRERELRLGLAFADSRGESWTADRLRAWLQNSLLKHSQTHALRRGGADAAAARGGLIYTRALGNWAHRSEVVFDYLSADLRAELRRKQQQL